MVSPEIEQSGRSLAQRLRHEGREDDALVVDMLLQNFKSARSSVAYATTSEVARRLGVSRQTVVNWIKRGTIPGVKLGARLVIPAAALSKLEEIESLLTIVEDGGAPYPTEDQLRVLHEDREQWTWVGKGE